MQCITRTEVAEDQYKHARGPMTSRQKQFEVEKTMESSQTEGYSATDIKEDLDEASNVFKKVKECLKRPKSDSSIAHSQVTLSQTAQGSPLVY